VSKSKGSREEGSREGGWEPEELGGSRGVAVTHLAAHVEQVDPPVLIEEHI